MTSAQIQELLTGAAVVALGYALYKHFKPTRTGQKAPAKAAAPGGLAGLLAGTVDDLAIDNSGFFNSMGGYYSTDDQINAAAGVDTSGNDSIVRKDAWWY